MEIVMGEFVKLRDCVRFVILAGKPADSPEGGLPFLPRQGKVGSKGCTTVGGRSTLPVKMGGIGGAREGL